MKNTTILFSVFLLIFNQIIFGQSSLNSNRKLFSNSESIVLKYIKDSKNYVAKKDLKNAVKYSDSIRMAIIGSYIGEYNFISVKGSVYNTSKKTKPLFLQATASWCAPCRAEIPALNKIVEKHSNVIDFVLLFHDTKDNLLKITDKYNDKILLIPSDITYPNSTNMSVAGFKHFFSYPTNYLVNRNNKLLRWWSHS